MKRKASKQQATESSPIQNRCIWMTAGVISFKLCPLEYDCEHCDFDEVMRSQVKSKRDRSRARRDKSGVSATSESVSASSLEPAKSLFFTFSAGKVDEELYLHPSHVWLRRVAHQKWRLGIGRLLAYVLPPPVEVQLYDSNTRVMQHQLFGKLGTLTRINPRVLQQPELVQQDPEREGWLAEIDRSPKDSELESLYVGPAAERFLEEEAQHLNFLLKHRGIAVDNIGDTLPDGGVNVKYLHQLLPGQVCLRLAVELIASGKQGW
jgi:glycine cleavage system H lipoate-binding protein